MYLIIKVFLWVFLECFGGNVFIWSKTLENKNHLYLGCPDILSKWLCAAKIWFFSHCLIPYQPCHILFCPVFWQILHSRALNPQFSFWVSPVPAILRILHLSLKTHPSNSASTSWKLERAQQTQHSCQGQGFFPLPVIFCYESDGSCHCSTPAAFPWECRVTLDTPVTAQKGRWGWSLPPICSISPPLPKHGEFKDKAGSRMRQNDCRNSELLRCKLVKHNQSQIWGQFWYNPRCLMELCQLQRMWILIVSVRNNSHSPPQLVF